MTNPEVRQLADANPCSSGAPESLRAVLEAMPAATLVVDCQGRLLCANTRLHELLGRPKDTLCGSELAELVPERLRELHLRGFERACSGQSPVVDGRPLRVAALCADGEEISVDLRIGEWRPQADAPRSFLATLHPVSDERTLLADARIANRYLRVTNRMATLVGRPGASLETVVGESLSLLGNGLGWDFGALWIADPAAERLRLAGDWARGELRTSELVNVTRQWAPRRNEGLVGRAWQSRRTVWIGRLPVSMVSRRPAAKAAGINGWVTVPLTSGSEVRGVLEFARRAEGPIEGDLLGALGTAAQLLGQLVHRTQAEADLVSSNERFALLARTFQESLLPPNLPTLSWVDVGASYRPGGEGDVGGDFYDVFATSGNAWHVVIGDVCGRGAEAAVVTSLARHTLRAAAMQHPSPQRVLSVLNEVLVRELKGEGFLTALCLRMTPSAEGVSMTIASGGHPLPYVIGTGGEVRTVGKPGSLMGVLAEIEAEEVDFVLRPGETFVCYTDGVTEARGPGGFLGDRLPAFLATLDGPAASIAGAIEKKVADHSEGKEGDDMAVVVLKAR